MAKRQPANLTDVEAELGSLIAAAADYIEEEVGPERAAATAYYHGAPFGDEEEGRSQFISRDVRDTVQAMLPSLLRIFFGPEDVLEFAPTSGMKAKVAEQATDVVRHIIEAENDGFSVAYDGIKDALIRRTGVFTWYYDDSTDYRFEEREGLSETDLLVLADDDTAEVEVLEEYEAPEEAQPPPEMVMAMTEAGMPAPPRVMLSDVRIKRVAKRGRYVWAAIPPEEFIIDRRARSVQDSDLCGWQRMLPAHTLISMGYEMAEIEDHLGQDELQDNEERIARDEDEVTDLGDLEPRALYAEVYARFDIDGDGYAELRKFCVIGAERKILHHEYADEAPFAVACPDPEPHRWIGHSVSDHTMDIQRVKSYMMRAMLDSLAQSIRPRMGVVDSQVNIEDLLNNEVGALIRMRQPGMVQPLDTPFVGREALGVLAYMDEVKENRTGISKAAAGLDADALQSSTRAAVAATISASHQQIEMVARLLAVSLKQVFMGLYRLFKKHQDRARTMRLRGEWVEIDPRSWPSEMDVVVNVALGDGDKAEKVALLTQVAMEQKTILMEQGLDNPLVGLRQYRNTLGRIIRMGGFRDVSEFFKEIPEDWAPPPADPNAKPADPAMAAVELQAQVEQAKLAQSKELEEAKLQQQAAVEAAKDDRERDKADRDFWLAKTELELKYAAQLDAAEINAQVAMDRNRRQADAAAQRSAQQPTPGAQQ